MEHQKKLFKAIRQRIGNYRLVDVVSELLGISEDTAYRRIRCCSELTLSETKTLCNAYNISLDDIISSENPTFVKPYYMHCPSVFDMSYCEFNKYEQSIMSLKQASTCEYSEFGVASTNITFHMRTLFPDIFRLFMLKWAYSRGKHLDYSQMQLNQKLVEQNVRYSRAIEGVKNTYIVYPEFPLKQVVRDVVFFRNIGLIADEDVVLIKDSLHRYVQYTTKLLTNGIYDNGNHIDIYVSGMSVESSCCYLKYDDRIHSLISVFTVDTLSAPDTESSKNIQQWINSLRRTATLVTGSEINTVYFANNMYKNLKELD